MHADITLCKQAEGLNNYGTSGKFYIRFQRMMFSREISPKFNHLFLVLVNFAGRNKKQLRVGNTFFSTLTQLVYLISKAIVDGGYLHPNHVQQHSSSKNNKLKSYFIFNTNNTTLLTDYNKYQMSLTNARDVLHHCKRAANKGGCSV